MKTMQYTTSIVMSLFLMACPFHTEAQPLINDLIVETYYISDANDATDTEGGTLQEGSVTYRVFLELSEGSSLIELFGNANHAFFIKSTTPFFNHEDRGQTYGFDIRDNRLGENTVALDSWLSFGQASRSRLGVLKVEDTDGSVIGGVNNDGGSAGIEGGLLVNSDPEAGIPLTDADGLLPWPAPGFAGFTFNQFFDNPASVFGTQTVSNIFESNNFRLNTPNAVQGPTSNNRVLIAQLTTTGELEFEINAIVRSAAGTNISYVARDANVGQAEVLSPFLRYPPQCGCTDPNFLEFSAAAPCDDGSCSTPVVLGCSDPDACNYNAAVNFNIPQLCCYTPTECNGLDWTIICPTLDSDNVRENSWSLYPNPAVDEVNLRLPNPLPAGLSAEVYTLQGKKVLAQALPSTSSSSLAMDVSSLPVGMYILRVQDGPHSILFTSKLSKTH